jgi:hypothetical protein
LQECVKNKATYEVKFCNEKYKQKKESEEKKSTSTENDYYELDVNKNM